MEIYGISDSILYISKLYLFDMSTCSVVFYWWKDCLMIVLGVEGISLPIAMIKSK